MQQDIYLLDELPPLGGEDIPEVERSVETIEKYGQNHVDSYAGLFLSERTLLVGWVRSAEEHLAALRSLVNEVPVAAFRARHTKQDLDALASLIAKDAARWREEGILLSSVGGEIYRNRVRLGLTGSSHAGITRLRKAYDESMIDFGEETMFLA
jgi:hypothetical protein